VPGLAAGFLALLPWIDRGPARDPRQRRGVMAIVTLGLAAVVTLTVLGWRDSPSSGASSETWRLSEIGGRTFAQNAACARCHSETGLADPLEGMPTARGPEWVAGHIMDPEMIAPGIRETPTALNEREVAAMVAYARRAARQPYPGFPPQTEEAAAVFARFCVRCHTVDGDGGTDGPDLSHAGSKHDAATLRRWIVDPELVDPNAEMPAFGERLSASQLEAIAGYLAGRK
jgi:mono/diheme cytochrome c family protein